MSDVSVINEDAVRAYAGKTPIEVVGACIDVGKPFTDVERAYCSQYFTEQFAMLDADEELVRSYGNDPVFEGLDVQHMLANGEPLPAYAQERQDMYDKVDSDFAGRTVALIDDFVEAYDLMRNAEQVPGQFSGSGLVDEGTLRLLLDNGLPRSMTLPKQDGPYMPSQLAMATVEGGDYKMQWTDAYMCNTHVSNTICSLGFHDDDGKPGFATPEDEAAARKQLGELLNDVKVGQELLNDKTPAGVAPYSMLCYNTVKDLHELGFDYDIKGMSAESLCDIYGLTPEEMVSCAEEAGIKWDDSMQARMDRWISDNGFSRDAGAEDFVDSVLKAERMAGASTSGVFERRVADGAFPNGSKVQLYGSKSREILDQFGYEERSKEMFDDYLKDMAQRHTGASVETLARSDREIRNKPNFMAEDGHDGMQMN